jgi:hypothetical protein
MPKSTLCNNALCKEQEIQITIIRAFNLMDRSSTILTEDHEADNDTIAGKTSFLFPILIPLSGVGTKWFSVCSDRFGNYYYDRPPA